MIQHWTGLRLQGQLACLLSADQNVSHTVLKNTAMQDDIHRFTIKAHEQCTRQTGKNHFPNTPDIVEINEHTKAVTILETGCSLCLHGHLLCFKTDEISTIVQCLQ